MAKQIAGEAGGLWTKKIPASFFTRRVLTHGEVRRTAEVALL
jgi:hypothetical protein